MYWELAGRRAGDPCEVHQDLLCSEVLPLWQGPSRAALLCRAGAPAARRSPGWYLVLSTRSHTHTHRHFYLCFVLVFAALQGWGLVWLPGDTLNLSQVMRTVLQPNSSPSTGASVRAGPTHSQQYVFFIGRNTRLQLHAVVYS